MVVVQITHDQHTVPKLLLRGFMDRRTKTLLARHRTGHDGHVSFKHATVEQDFYDIGDGITPDTTLEEWFGRNVEAPVGEIVGELRKGVLPIAARRRTMATFIALQMVRTIRFRDLMGELGETLGPMLFANEVLQRVIAAAPDLKGSGANLTAWHAQIAADAPVAMRSTDRRSIFRNMARKADRLKPMLEQCTGRCRPHRHDSS